MRGMTHREYEVRIEWMRQELEHPSREDWYSMQTAMEVRRLRMARAGVDLNLVQLQDMKLHKKKEVTPLKPVTREDAAKRARGRWFGWLKIKGD